MAIARLRPITLHPTARGLNCRTESGLFTDVTCLSRVLLLLSPPNLYIFLHYTPHLPTTAFSNTHHHPPTSTNLSLPYITIITAVSWYLAGLPSHHFQNSDSQIFILLVELPSIPTTRYLELLPAQEETCFVVCILTSLIISLPHLNNHIRTQYTYEAGG